MSVPTTTTGVLSAGRMSSLSRRSDDQHLQDLALGADQRWCAREASSCDIAGQTSLRRSCTLERYADHPSSGFKLESLPPTTAAAMFHSYRAYIAVQQWMGNNLSPMIGVGSIGTGIGTGFWSQSIQIGQKHRHECCESCHAVARQVVRKHVDVGRQCYTVQQCAVTIIGKHAAKLAHYMQVQILTMTHKCVSATAKPIVLAYDFLYIDLCSAALYYVTLLLSVPIIYFHVQLHAHNILSLVHDSRTYIIHEDKRY